MPMAQGFYPILPRFPPTPLYWFEGRGGSRPPSRRPQPTVSRPDRAALALLFSHLPANDPNAISREAFVAPPVTPSYKGGPVGEVPEWSIGTVSKTVVRASVP